MKIAGLEVKKPAPLPEYNVFMIDSVAGGGKTTLTGTVGKGNRVLIIDLEGGTVSFSSPTFPTLPDATEIENIDIISIPQLGEGSINNAAKLMQSIEGVFDHLIQTKNSEGYALVSIDSMPELQQRFLDLHAAPDPRQSYGAWAQGLYGLVHKMRATPVNTVLVSRPSVASDEVSGKDIVRSAISPAAWKLVSGLVDANGLLSVKTTPSGKLIRTLDFTHDQRYAAKTRMNLGVIENPTFKKITDLIAEGGKPVTEEATEVAKPKRVPSFPRK